MRVVLALGVAYLVLTAALIGLAGCNARYAAQQCFSIDDCQGGRVCFFGTCQDPNATIQSVYAELTPPSSTTYLTQQTDLLPLSEGYQTVTLFATSTVTGHVSATDGAYGGTLIAQRIGTIAGHDIVRRAPVDVETGYELHVTPGQYALRFVPAEPTVAAAATGTPRPPLRYQPTIIQTGSSIANLTYPAATELVTVQGRLLYTDFGWDVVWGAEVSATSPDDRSTDASPYLPLESTTDTTGPDGTYTLVFPPHARGPFTVSVRPDGNGLVPELTTTPIAPAPAAAPGSPLQLADIVLGAKVFALDATIRDGAGAPVQYADVYFEGSMSIDGSPASYTARLTADDQGVVSGATLFPGDYVVTVVPSKTDVVNAMTATTKTPLAAGGQPLALQVGTKVHLKGIVLSYENEAVTDARVTLALRDAPAPREYTVQTTATGSYEVYVDPGDYDVTVEPAVGKPQPRYRSLEHLTGGEQNLDIQLYKATFVYGRVFAADGTTPMAGVNIAFYSSDLSSEPTPVLVGLGTTGPGGEFAVPLPTLDGT